jgi:hypothetical protein
MLINTRTYNVDRVQPDAVQYTGPANTITLKDRFEMKRAYPKASGTYLGVAKPQAKLTKTVTVNAVTGAVADRILNIVAVSLLGRLTLISQQCWQTVQPSSRQARLWHCLKLWMSTRKR